MIGTSFFVKFKFEIFLIPSGQRKFDQFIFLK